MTAVPTVLASSTHPIVVGNGEPRPPAVAVTGLTKCFGSRTVVDHLDIELPAGVVAGFVGPNGAGKTTTMAMLLGLVRPTEGSGTVLGASIDEPAAYLPRVGALVEYPAFYSALSGAENLRMFAIVGGQDTASIPALLAMVGLEGRGDDPYRSYSLGMKQRLGIAAALLGEPDLLLLDEPANGLDPQGVREMRSLVGRLADTGRTILVSSHDLSELEQVCDWLVLIDTGRSLYQGPTRELLDGVVTGVAVVPQRSDELPRMRTLLSGHGYDVESRDDRLVVRPGDADAAEIAASVSRAACQAGIVLVELTPCRTTLEDRYLMMVQGGSQ